ncbi:MAG: HAD hydrolase-like protein [Thermoleophilia bacterium]|nr:HAD hydrolase-like protein [Thermoleophilia bacterium]
MTDRGRHGTSGCHYRQDGRPFRLEGVVFDFDGTLTEPGAIDFVAIHESVGCPREVGLLEFLADIEDPEERRGKEAVLTAAEMAAAERCRANPGASELLAFLQENHAPMAIITRSSRAALETAFAKLSDIDQADFVSIVTRDMPLSPKPFPDAVRFVARQMGVSAADLLVVGDHAFDIEAGIRAGSITMFLRNDPRESRSDGGADFVVDTLAEALEVMRFGLPLPVGKLPADLLAQGLKGIAHDDPALLIGAAVGEDAAAVDVSGAEVLVAASDPTTLAADSMARYAVLVNSNDIAASGAVPRWLLSTLLLPPGCSASEVLSVIRDIQDVCAACGVVLCGGHTEVSDAVTRPVIVGTMLGIVPKDRLIAKRQMQEGDRLLLTKRVAVEGTALLARECRSRLLAAGMTTVEVEEAGAFLERIGILEEARIAWSFDGVTALHDVTEGGLATAVKELGAAGGRRLRLHMEKIPVYPQTQRICSVLGLDPLGLIGSGSLLITCSPAVASSLAAAITAAGIEVTEIGEVLGPGEGIEAFGEGARGEWPRFERDEVSRLGR